MAAPVAQPRVSSPVDRQCQRILTADSLSLWGPFSCLRPAIRRKLSPMLGLPNDPPAGADEDPLGPPVLLKRLGNTFEGELARSRLTAADIPSFLAGVDTFSVKPGSARGQVELFVPRTLVHEALDVLELAADDDRDDEPAPPDDPGRPLAFRAFVSAVSGWLVVFLGPFGIWIAVPLFVYSIVLAVRAVRRSPVADRTLRLQVAATILIASIGVLVSIAFGVEMAGWL